MILLRRRGASLSCAGWSGTSKERFAVDELMVAFGEGAGRSRAMKRSWWMVVLGVVALAAPAWGFDLAADRAGVLRFFGSEAAELLTKEIDASFKGVLEWNYIAKTNDEFPAGFLHASPPPQGWSGTFWTRDGGTFMRELVMWGYFEHAALTADCLINLVEKNDQGYYAFPEYFRGHEKRSGHEMDGTTSIIIGMVLLWERLDADHAFRPRIYEFLHGPASPVRFIHAELKKRPLIAGSGEFGGGCGIEGLYCNVVQNHLAVLALRAAANMEEAAGDVKLAEVYHRDADKLFANMKRYVVNEDGSWIWCINPETLKPEPKVINFEINKGFGGLNGVACMYSDVLGFDPVGDGWEGVKPCMATFDRLFAWPLRREQFEKYGIWTQFDEFRLGLSSGPSYGDGYAQQTMLLYDKMDMADKALAWLAKSTYEAQGVKFEFDGKPVPRRSPYHFYERNYSPDAIGKMDTTVGCGPLNLVNVTEPLKVARLVLGLDDTSPDVVRIIPRVPPSWGGVEATDWPVRTAANVVRASIRAERVDGAMVLSIQIQDGKRIPQLRVRLPGPRGYAWQSQTDVADWRVRSPE
jgi:hypothetical protein